MKKLNTHELYKLGATLRPLTDLKQEETPLGKLWLSLFRARTELQRHIGSEGIFSASCKRATGAVLRVFLRIGLPDNMAEFDFDSNKMVPRHEIVQMQQAIKDFETILANELPGIATYYVLTKGIYSTDDLITHADEHLPRSLRDGLPEQAKIDMREAGRCLAFEVPTASAFHMWRAVESVMNSFHFFLTGKNFSDVNISRNWGQYIPALEAAGADSKITVFLDHIRAEYRNPISHPTENVELDNAFGLFGTAFSVIGQMIQEMRNLAAERSLAIALSEPSGSGDALAALGITPSE